MTAKVKTHSTPPVSTKRKSATTSSPAAVSAPHDLFLASKAVGGNFGGDRASLPGPGRPPRDRSLFLLIVGQQVVWYSFATDPPETVLPYLRALGLNPAPNATTNRALIRALTAGQLDTRKRLQIDAQLRLRSAQSIWDESIPLAGTPGADFLQRKFQTAPDSVGADIRFSHRAPWMPYWRKGGGELPAIVAAIRGHSGNLIGVNLTYMPKRAARTAEPPQKIVGAASGGTVAIGRIGPELVIARAMSDALTFSASLSLPAVALLQRSNLLAFRPPVCVKRAVLIANPSDKRATQTADEVAANLVTAGVAVHIEEVRQAQVSAP